MNPVDFKPQTADQFIGPAAATALLLDEVIERCRQTAAPIKILLHGDPGVGKSALLDYLTAGLRVDKWAITKLSGTKIRLDQVEDFERNLCYCELGGGYKILRIEEMDRASHTARAGMLTMLDDLPSKVGVICTSNQKLDDIEPRFLSRFQSIHVKPPTAEEIRKLLKPYWLPVDVLARISEFSCGNVRLALFKAQTALDEINAHRKHAA